MYRLLWIVAGNCESRIRAAFLIYELREAGVNPVFPFRDAMRVATQLAKELGYMVELQDQLRGMSAMRDRTSTSYYIEEGQYRIIE